ncbi:histidine kinase [Natrinema salsiterrestre]|uniref:Histidine kinase n=1 Tax=Natrinema salsiterrestre TaxID=2950540 RepID=A0A9Q4L1H8_9EURY|nr:histidine kinase [Natrinema salsiterrestre]MDF9748345.1 histidine kinase [Natrinema salsiterrestre]
MASETMTRRPERTETALEHWQAGTVGGIVGALVFGAMMAMQTPPVLEAAIPAMYGLEGGLAGTVIHVSHGAVLGVVFAALLVATGRTELGLGSSAAVGLAYGLGVWAVLAVVVMPIWLSAVGFGMAPDVPNVAVESLVGHAAYGLVLGVVYAVLD